MSKKAMRRALIGFAEGAARTYMQAYQTKRAQEIEEARVARLEAIRAQERGEDRAFQREQTDRQLAAQEARDTRTAQQQAERDARLFEQQAQRDAAQNEQRMREIEEGRKTQLAVAGAYRQEQQPPATKFLVDRDGVRAVVSESELRPGDVTVAGITGSGGIVPLMNRGSGTTDGSTTTVGGRPPLIGGDVGQTPGRIGTAATGNRNGVIVAPPSQSARSAREVLTGN